MRHSLPSVSKLVFAMRVSAFILLYGLVAVASVVPIAASKIAGGQEASPGQFPWQVSLSLTNTEETWHLCGGILVSSEWVLIAAHCLDSEKPEWLAVVSGDHKQNVDEGTEQLLYVDNFIQHPDYIYYQKPYINDVALVHVSGNFIFDNFTQATPIRTSQTPLPASCIEAGWGRLDENTPSSVLMYVDVPIQPSEYCETAYGSPPDPNALCGGYMEGGIGFCEGDNGGGLQCWEEAGGQNVISGIMSWRSGCAEPNKPAVYMDVAAYAEWILSIINQ